MSRPGSAATGAQQSLQQARRDLAGFLGGYKSPWLHLRGLLRVNRLERKVDQDLDLDLDFGPWTWTLNLDMDLHPGPALLPI